MQGCQSDQSDKTNGAFSSRTRDKGAQKSSIMDVEGGGITVEQQSMTLQVTHKIPAGQTAMSWQGVCFCLYMEKTRPTAVVFPFSYGTQAIRTETTASRLASRRPCHSQPLWMKEAARVAVSQRTRKSNQYGGTGTALARASTTGPLLFCQPSSEYSCCCCLCFSLVR